MAFGEVAFYNENLKIKCSLSFSFSLFLYVSPSPSSYVSVCYCNYIACKLFVKLQGNHTVAQFAHWSSLIKNYSHLFCHLYGDIQATQILPWFSSKLYIVYVWASNKPVLNRQRNWSNKRVTHLQNGILRKYKCDYQTYMSSSDLDLTVYVTL